MKHHHLRSSLFAFSLLGAAVAARAAAPTVTVLRAEQVLLGETMALHAEVADAGGDLQSLSFYVAGPGITSELELGPNTISGASAAVDRTWTPTQVGPYTIRVHVSDTTAAQCSASRTTYAFAERVTVQDVNLVSGEEQIYSSDGELRTKENNTATEVRAQSGATMVFWAQTRVVLKPGFRADSGAIIWAATDSDLDGYSDQEEATDSDGDGMFDAWEYEHGLNLFVNDAAGDLDNDGHDNLKEFRENTDPQSNADAMALPANIRLVLRLPNNTYAGLKTGTWQFDTAVPTP